LNDEIKVDKLQAYAVAKGHATRAGPTQALKETLEALCSDEKNVVFVVSGKELYAVSEFFGDVKGLGLGAEHGFYYRWPALRDESLLGLETESGLPCKSKWQTIHALGDQTWKLAAKLVMDMYVQRTHGTYVEQKGNELIWQFRDADPEFGFIQSKELEAHLKELMAVYEVEVSRGGGVSDGYIEVRPKGVSKGLFLNHAIATMKANQRYPDFILAIGDDSSDEPMFAELNHLLPGPRPVSPEGRNSPGNEEVSVYSVTVGKKPSVAQCFVDDPAAVMQVLSTLIKSSHRSTAHFSSADLVSHEGAKDYNYPKRASSAGDLTMSVSENEADLRPNFNFEESFEKPSKDTGTLGRSGSGAHLSMSQYLDR
jgi:trehalose 6-phosphate synthase/phosphatase